MGANGGSKPTACLTFQNLQRTGVIVEERMEGVGDRKAGAFFHLFSHSLCSFWLQKIHFLLILTERSSEGGRAPNASQERRRK